MLSLCHSHSASCVNKSYFWRTSSVVFALQAAVNPFKVSFVCWSHLLFPDSQLLRKAIYTLRSVKNTAPQTTPPRPSHVDTIVHTHTHTHTLPASFLKAAFHARKLGTLRQLVTTEIE